LPTKVYPHELDDEDLALFYRAVETDEHHGSVEDLISDIYDNRLEIWLRKTDESKYILVTEVLESRDGSKELFINMCSGVGLFKDQFQIDLLKDHARKRGCSSISAYVKPKIAADQFNLISEIKDNKEREDNGLCVFDMTYVVISTRV
jgi:hypothetical protein|tara:strand:+ start:1003 stop:1446 length:444 start_codon:yes stop_codon:yes gene_type:complete